MMFSNLYEFYRFVQIRMYNLPGNTHVDRRWEITCVGIPYTVCYRGISIHLKRYYSSSRCVHLIIYAVPPNQIANAMDIRRACVNESVTKQQAVTKSPAWRRRGDQRRRNCEKTRLLHNTVEMFERRRCVFYFFYFIF